MIHPRPDCLRRFLYALLGSAIVAGAVACQAFWVVPPSRTSLPTATAVPTALPRTPTPQEPIAEVLATPTLEVIDEPPSNRLDLTSDSVQYWSNPNSIHDLVFDGTYVWAATYGGVVRWSRTGEHVLYGMREGLASQAVQALAVDSLGRLWVGYADVDGMTVRVDEAWQHYATRREAVQTEYGVLLSPQRGHARLWSNRTDSAWIWLPRSDGQVEAYDGARWRVYGADNGVTPASNMVGVAPGGRVWAVGMGVAYAEEGELWWGDHTFFSEVESSDDVTSMAVDDQGTVWITFAGPSRGGLIRYDPEDERWEGHLPDINPAIPPAVHGLEIEPDGTLWVCGQGLLSYQRPQRRFQSFDLGDVTALSFARDGQDRIWVGSDHGLWLLDVESGALTGPWTVPSPLPDNKITGLAINATGTVYVGTPRGISWIDSDGLTERVSETSVSWLGTDAQGRVWAATAEGIGRIADDGQMDVQYTAGPIVAAAFGTEGDLVILSEDGKLSTVGAQETRELADVQLWTGAPGRNLALDSTGGIWVSTSAGLAHLAPDGVRTLYTKDNGLLSSDVRAVECDGDDTIWVATASGLARHRSDGRWTRFTTESTGGGLRDMDMRGLSVSVTNDLWMATRAGLSRRQPEAADWSYVDLPGAQKVLHDGQESLWISTGSGLYRVPTTVLTAVVEE